MHFELTPTAPCKYDLEVIVDIRGRGDYCFAELSIRGDRSSVVLPDLLDETIRKADSTGTRFEIFAADKESSAYTEYVFTLDNRWNCFTFTDTLEGKATPKQETPDIVIMPALKVFRHSAMISWDLLSDRLCGIAVVLQFEDGSESIWTLPGANKPEELHDRSNFIAEFKGESVVIPDSTNDQRLKGIVNIMQGNSDISGSGACSI